MGSVMVRESAHDVVRRARMAAGMVAIALTCMLVGMVPSANAARGDYGYTVGANVRACPGWCAIVAWAGAGSIRVWCWVDNQPYAGSPRWFQVSRDGQFGGYIHSSLLPGQPIVPHC
jgi:hypothetical protein